MKRTNPQGMVVNLRRGNVKTPWGIRIVGGVDLDTPFVVTRVQAGSPADGELQRGDLIKKIGDYDARDLRHEDAQNLFKSAGNTISLAVKRSVVGQTFGPTYTPFQESVGGDAATTFAQEVFQSPSTSTLNKSASVVFPPPLPSSHPNLARPHSTTLLQTWANPEEEDTSLSNQPYRTTPLVLPGAKVKKDPSDTVSYLRHHPNPSFRAHPSQYDTTAEVLMKHKVADSVLQRVVGEETANKQVVHKQFNSPIGLYSELNIAETIQSQTGVTPNARIRASLLNPRNQAKVSLRKTVTYDPAKSETFKALQEDELGDSIQEVTVPVQHKVFAPNKPVAGQSVLIKKPALSQQVNYLNALGGSEETIHQSGSFKRLMNAVLGESEF